ncbi:MAG: hypothetical protein V1875_00320 [Candidatus Altiarchaeota archaeon]
MRTLAVLLLVSFVCGCFCCTPGGGPGGLKTTSTNGGSTVSIPSDRNFCESQGGRWGAIGRFPKEVCNLPTSDGGNACSGQDDCVGACLADLDQKEMEAARNGQTISASGRCTPWRMTVGCQARVEDGKVRGILCMD